MKILLDTHTFLWFINDSSELSNAAADLLESDVDLLLSMASLWEIAIKVSLNKLTLPDDYERFIPQQITLNNIEILIWSGWIWRATFSASPFWRLVSLPNQNP